MKKFILLAIIITNSLITFSQWSSHNLNSPRTQMGAAASSTHVIFGCGIGAISIPSPAFDMYNETTGLWTNGSTSNGRTWPASAACGTKIFFAGGENDNIL